jgi:hypothetical protein
MAESAPTPFDPATLLGKLKDVVAEKKDAATGGGKSWVGTIILVAVTLIGAAVWAWISWRRNQELAKLRHEKFVTEVKAAQAVVDLKLREDADKIERSKAIELAAAEKVRLIEADIRAEEGRYAADLRAIDSIRSWRDVDTGAR